MADRRILTHGGAGSDPDHADATEQAVRIAREALETGSDPVEAACHAVAHLEDDERFNAGTGSNLRSDGKTVEMDAACAGSAGGFGAVACLERVRHPVFVAHQVMGTEHLVLAGNGARRFARSRGVPDHDPRTETARERFEEHQDEAGTADTVGCVLREGERFAAALSTGGPRGAPVGRVGDVPLPGCGLRAGPAGAVAATGHGETIARRRIADAAYRRLEAGRSAQEVVEAVLEATEEGTNLGLLVLGEGDGAGGATGTMAWSRAEP